jgi:hypothetical protein
MTEAVARRNFQDLIESVESLAIEDREMLVEIINKRIIEQRRDELLADMKESLEAYSRGDARVGTVGDLLKDLKEDLRDEDCHLG